MNYLSDTFNKLRVNIIDPNHILTMMEMATSTLSTTQKTQGNLTSSHSDIFQEQRDNTVDPRIILIKFRAHILKSKLIKNWIKPLNLSKQAYPKRRMT